MSAKVYNLDQVACSAGGALLSGYGQGGAIKIEQMGEDIKVVTGVDGETVFSRSNNKCRKVTITLLQTAFANLIMTGLHKANMAAPNGILFPFGILDTGGSSVFASGAACIVGFPDGLEFTNEAKDREWVLYAIEDLQIVGNN